MKLDRTCVYCETTFLNEEGKVFANHVRWCNKNTTNGDKGILKCSQKATEHYLIKFGEIKGYNVTCQKCQSNFLVREREKRHPERDFYFCSRSCANSRGPRSESFKEKVRAKLKKDELKKQCEFCHETFVCNKKVTQSFCSLSCSNKNRYKNIDKASLKYYRIECSFKFNLSDYPDEFDFSLVEKHGWYAAKNHGNNLGGVSRDHIVSIKFGYENGIDPSIISHPANCRLLIHNSNISKGANCGMTIEQLIQKIENWDLKYPIKN